MTSLNARRRFLSPLVASVVTAATLAAALWVQHSRQAWPFAPADQAAAAGDTHDIQSMTQTAAASGDSRVPIDLDEATLDDLGIRVEFVTRESLAETVRIVATVAPDESRISQVHTRVAGWIEQLDVNTTGELVRAGQPLARIFSQELLSSQTEYLAARRATQASGITS